MCPVLLLDTNVVLDWLAFGDTAIVPIAEAVASGRVRLISSAACIDELQRALGYKAITLDAAAQARALATYRGRVDLRDAPPEGSLPMLPRCEDRDDQKFLELAWHARARWLVSRDKALLKLAPKLARMGRFAVIPPAGTLSAGDETEVEQSHAQQRHNARQVGRHRDDICRTTPPAAHGERNRGGEQQVAEHAGEVNAAGNAGGAVDVANRPLGLAREQNKQFGDRHRFGQHDRDGHEEDEVPGLVGGQQFHVMGHCHDDSP